MGNIQHDVVVVSNFNLLFKIGARFGLDAPPQLASQHLTHAVQAEGDPQKLQKNELHFMSSTTSS